MLRVHHCQSREHPSVRETWCVSESETPPQGGRDRLTCSGLMLVSSWSHTPPHQSQFKPLSFVLCRSHVALFPPGGACAGGTPPLPAAPDPAKAHRCRHRPLWRKPDIAITRLRALSFSLSASLSVCLVLPRCLSKSISPSSLTTSLLHACSLRRCPPSPCCPTCPSALQPVLCVLCVCRHLQAAGPGPH
jgi:hypothetical protein